MLLWAATAAVANAEDVARTSRTIGAVLRELGQAEGVAPAEGALEAV